VQFQQGANAKATAKGTMPSMAFRSVTKYLPLYGIADGWNIVAEPET